MKGPSSSPFLVTSLVALLAGGAALAAQEAPQVGSQQTPEPQSEERWIPCPYEPDQVAEARPQEPPPAGVACPCFESSDLANLPKGEFDLCVRGTYVDQVTRWAGSRSRSGQEGFNVLVSMASPRSPQSSCLFLHRHASLDGMQQSHRRFVNLPEPQAAACRRLLAEWIDSRGRCAGITATRP